MSDSLRNKAGSALFWNFIDKGGQQIIQMIFLFVLARLLAPEEFGLVALLSVFTVLANIVQDSGFYSALVRKKDADETDYSSVFYFNITVSIVLYLILYLCAPAIAWFYERPVLTDLARIMFLGIVFNSLSIIQYVRLVKKLDFKTNTKITFVAGAVSGVIAIAMAYSGYGVWSLAAQTVLQVLIRSVLLWIFVKWQPSTGFVLGRIRAMFGYSANLLLNSVINQLSTRIYSLVIGKYFSITDVAYYDQAYKLNNIPQGTIGSSINGVAFPVLSEIDTPERMKRVFRKILRIASFVSFPVAMFTIIAAQPIVTILLSEKWLLIIPLLQILAIGWAFYPSFCLTSVLLQALGKSDLLLKIELSRSILYILAIFLSISFGLTGLAIGFSVVNIIAFIYGFYFSGKLIAYRLKEIFKDIVPYITIAIIVFTPLSFLKGALANPGLEFAIQLTVGFSAYLLAVKVLGSQVFADCLDFVKMKSNRKNE